MIEPRQLASAFERNVQIVRMQTKGLTHEQSLLQLPFRGNCLNWVVGHLVTNRNEVLRLLGEPPELDDVAADRYVRESDPIGSDGAGVLPLESLVAGLERAQERIGTRLDSLGPAELDQEVQLFGGRTRPLKDALFFLYFHDAYHTGQTELLRQATGVDDKVI